MADKENIIERTKSRISKKYNVKQTYLFDAIWDTTFRLHYRKGIRVVSRIFDEYIKSIAGFIE